MGNTNASLAFVSFLNGLSVRWLESWGADSGPAEVASKLDVALEELEELADSQAVRGLRAGISAVGGMDRELRLVQRLEGAGFSVSARPDAGLVMDIAHPETCGSDRQYAMRAALEDQWELRGNGGEAAQVRVIVVDAGTALTVDAGRAEPGLEGEGDSSPQLTFLGGAIAMGPGSLASAMAARGARLPEFDVEPDAPALGRSTVEALQSGVAVGFRGAVRELTQQVASDAFGSLDGVSVYLTGGARSFARRAVSESCRGGFHESAHLVHAGLARVLRAAGSKG